MTDKIELYKDGMRLYGEGKHDEAIAAFRGALEADPDFTDAMQALAMAQMNAGALEDARVTAEALCERTPEDPLAFTSLSMIYQRLDRIDDAETAQNKARLNSWKQEIKENPDAPPPTGINVVQ